MRVSTYVFPFGTHGALMNEIYTRARQIPNKGRWNVLVFLMSYRSRGPLIESKADLSQVEG